MCSPQMDPANEHLIQDCTYLCNVDKNILVHAHIIDSGFHSECVRVE